MVKLTCSEQCITLNPLTTHYSVGPFPAHVIFRPSQSPFILGLISSIRLLTARYCHFLLAGQIQPMVTLARLWSVNTLGHFHSVIKYGLLTMARYGHMSRIRPIDDTAHRRPIIYTARRRPIVSTARRRATVSTARRRPSVTTVNISPWLLWPSFKK